jgi:hypothetical protein
MSCAKATLRQTIRAWLSGAGPTPRIFRRCDACGEESWRPVDRAARQVEVNAWLQDGRRADLVLRDQRGRVLLVIQLASGSRLRDRSQTAAGAPLVVLDGGSVVGDALRWRPMRERGLPAWRCRCAHARALPVDDAFSLRVLGCPLNLRRHEQSSSFDGGAESYASVIHDCGRCGFFVGIGYSDPERRRVSLYCSFGAATHQRRPTLAAPAPHRAETTAPSISVERSRVA